MASIEKRKTARGISWRARTRLEGTDYSKTFPTKGEAQDWLRSIESQIRAGDVARVRATVAQLIDRYLKEVLPHKPRNKDKRHPTARLLHWKKQLGTLPLSNLTPDLIAQQRVKLLRKRSPSTVNRYISALSAALAHAVRLGWLRKNPARDLERLEEPGSCGKALTPDQRRGLLAAAGGDLHLFILLALTTAARRSELYGLRWDDCHIDGDHGHVTFRGTKNGTDRTVAVAGRALELLRERKRDGDKVFPRGLEKPWRKARAAAGLECRFHDLRHSAATYLAQLGLSPLEIAQVTGHKTMQMVRRYSHLTGDHTRDAIGKLSGIIDE